MLSFCRETCPCGCSDVQTNYQPAGGGNATHAVCKDPCDDKDTTSGATKIVDPRYRKPNMRRESTINERKLVGSVHKGGYKCHCRIERSDGTTYLTISLGCRKENCDFCCKSQYGSKTRTSTDMDMDMDMDMMDTNRGMDMDKSMRLREAEEAIVEMINEKLCKKGKAYIAKRKRAGEKSSAYLSGRAVKVCKGQMKG